MLLFCSWFPRHVIFLLHPKSSKRITRDCNPMIFITGESSSSVLDMRIGFFSAPESDPTATTVGKLFPIFFFAVFRAS